MRYGRNTFPLAGACSGGLDGIKSEKLEEMICAALNAIEARRAELNGNADSYDERVAL